MGHNLGDTSDQTTNRRVVCKACGATLEVVVDFSGKIVWSVNPDSHDFGAEQPSLRGQSKNIRVVCSADVMHSCGYTCADGILVESNQKA
jgi:hypothetical protein